MADFLPVIMPPSAEPSQQRQPVTVMVPRDDPPPHSTPQATATAVGGSDLEKVWIARARAGDVGASEAIFRAYYERLCAFAEGFVGSSDQAEDLVEEIFVRSWAARETCRGCDSLESYLYVAVRNQAFKFLRHQKVVNRASERDLQNGPIPGMGAAIGNPEENAAASELADAAQRAIASLPERSREAYLLHRQHGMSYAAIAEVMEISVKTVENHLGRAVKALRETLTPWTT